MLYSTMRSYGLDWVDALPFVEMGIRASKHSATKFSPFEGLFGRLPIMPQFIPVNMDFEIMTPEEFLKEIEERRASVRESIRKQNLEKERISQVNIFKEGDLVMIKYLPVRKTGVVSQRYDGHGVISKVLGVKSYMVRLGKSEYERQEDSLKKCHQKKFQDIESTKAKSLKQIGGLSTRIRKPTARYGFGLVGGE